MKSYYWNESLIQVKLRPFGALLWLAWGIEVRVDGRKFFPTVERLGLTTQTSFYIVRKDGSCVAGRVQSLAPIWFLPRTQCSISVNEEIIKKEILPLQKWYLTYLAWSIFTLFLMMSLFGFLIFVLIIYKAANL